MEKGSFVKYTPEQEIAVREIDAMATPEEIVEHSHKKPWTDPFMDMHAMHRMNLLWVDRMNNAKTVKELEDIKENIKDDYYLNQAQQTLKYVLNKFSCEECGGSGKGFLLGCGKCKGTGMQLDRPKVEMQAPYHAPMEALLD